MIFQNLETAIGCWVSAMLLVVASGSVPQPRLQKFQAEAPAEIHRRIERAPKSPEHSEPCPGFIIDAGHTTPHTLQLDALIKDIAAGKFDEVKGEGVEKKRSYAYICTLGKGGTESVVFRVTRTKAGLKGKVGIGEKVVALKIAFGDKAKAALENEAQMMSQAHAAAALADFVPEPDHYGWSKEKNYYFMEMPEVGITLDGLLAKKDNGMTPEKWRQYFDLVMQKIIIMHNQELSTCFVHGDMHLGNVALHPDDASKIYFIDWANARRCTLKNRQMAFDAKSIGFGIVGDLLFFSETLAKCACTAAKVIVQGKPATCYGKGGQMNANVYPETSAVKFAGFEAYAAVEQWTWAKMKELELKLAALIKSG